MSDAFSIVPIEVALDSRLTLRHVRVLIALYSFADGKSTKVWPSRRRLAERCRMPETRISTVTSELAALGWLVKEGKGGFSKASSYVLTVPDLGGNTVTDSVTVTESVTVTKPVTSTVTKLVTQTVTKPVTRKEGTSEGTSEGIPPLPPKGGNRSRASPAPWTTPPWINTSAWAEFEQHRKDIRKPLTDMARTKAANQLKTLTPEQQQACIDNTIQSRWVGLYPDKVTNNANSRTSGSESRSERNARISDEIEQRAKRWIDPASNGARGVG